MYMTDTEMAQLNRSLDKLYDAVLEWGLASDEVEDAIEMARALGADWSEIQIALDEGMEEREARQ